jgi:hypothetical protein
MNDRMDLGQSGIKNNRGKVFMLNHDSTCPYCRVVNKVCFWDAGPQANWQRHVLLMCVCPFVFGVPILLWVFREQPNAFVLWLLGGILFSLALLGFVVGCRGCNACVARLFGEL